MKNFTAGKGKVVTSQIEPGEDVVLNLHMSDDGKNPNISVKMNAVVEIIGLPAGRIRVLVDENDKTTVFYSRS